MQLKLSRLCRHFIRLLDIEAKYRHLESSWWKCSITLYLKQLGGSEYQLERSEPNRHSLFVGGAWTPLTLAEASSQRVLPLTSQEAARV